MKIKSYITVALAMMQSLRATEHWKPDECFYRGESFKCDSFFTNKAKNRRQKNKKRRR
jgi:hypothetical protein